MISAGIDTMLPRIGIFRLVFLPISLLWVVCPCGSSIFAQRLELDAVLCLAEKNAHDLKMAGMDVEIRRHRRDEVLSLYYPTIDLQLYNEYVYVPEKSTQGIVSVGSSVSTTLESTYQHSVVARLNYPLYDFGARGLKYENARREMDIARHNLDRTLMDLRIQVLETYTRGLRLWWRQDSALRVLALRKEIYRNAQQLKEAGTIGRRRLEMLALELAEALAWADDLETEYQNALNELTVYTAEFYTAKQTAFSDLPEPERNASPPEAARLPEIRAIEAQIGVKRVEAEIAKKEMFPRLLGFCSYRMYGNDPDSFERSVKEIAERDATVAVVAEWNLFSGFRDVSKIRRLNAEVERLCHEKKKRTAELVRDIQNSYQLHRFLVSRDAQRQRRQSLIRSSREVDRRLTKQQLIDRIACLEHEVDLVPHRLDLELKEIDRAEAGLKLAFWREGQGN